VPIAKLGLGFRGCNPVAVDEHGELGAIRRDVMTILTDHAASRQAAMALYGRMLLARNAG
jgi:type VI protein secretion system component VasF